MSSGWFRWQYVLPRVLLVLVALLAVQYCLGLAARSRAVRIGEAALGARCEIAHTRVSPTGRQVTLGGLRVTTIGKPAEQLLQADRCDFELGSFPLFQKETIIDRGWITGLHIGQLRPLRNSETCSSSGGTSPPGNWEQADRTAGDWIASIKKRFDKGHVDRLASIVQCKTLCDRWSERSVELQLRSQELKLRAATLQATVDSAQANPLRHTEFFNALPAKITALREEFEALAADVEKLPQDLEAQRRAVIAARRQDEQQLRETLHLEPIDSKLFSEYLLREQVSGPLDEMICWLRWARKIVPEDPAERSSPVVLIRALEMEGSAAWGGAAVDLRGVLTGVTNAPGRLGEPMRLRLTAGGALPMTLHATIDRSGSAPRDELIVDCRGVKLPGYELGRSNQLAVKIAPTAGSLLVSVNVEGDKLSGEIQLVQDQAQLTPALGGELSDLPLTASLQSTLGQVNSIATRISLGGTMEKPTCTMWSNLGPAVAEALEQSLRRCGDEHAQGLLAEARRQVDERLAALDRQVANDQAEFAAQMARVTSQLEIIAHQQSQRERNSAGQLGRRLPAGSLLR